MDDDWHDIEILTPSDSEWAQADYLQLKPYDSGRKMQIEAGSSRVLLPLLGTVRQYAVELIMKDGTWHFLHIGPDLTTAKHMIQTLSAAHDLPISRLSPKRSDVEGY